MAAELLTITKVNGDRGELVANVQSLNHMLCMGGELLVTERNGGMIVVVTYWD